MKISRESAVPGRLEGRGERALDHGIAVALPSVHLVALRPMVLMLPFSWLRSRRISCARGAASRVSENMGAGRALPVSFHLQTPVRRSRSGTIPLITLVASLALGALSTPLHAQESESMADRALNQLVEHQKELLAEAAKENPNFDQNNFQLQIEQVCRGYEELLRANPKLAAGYAAYGYLLGKLDQRKQSIAMLLKANQLDPDQPLVKNQIGNYLAEEGKPLDALPYYMAAIKLAPKEPLYHYQLGTLLHEARDDFLKSGEWKQDAVDRAIHDAFRQAAELAPDRIEFTYRYAESFYDLETPDWDAALKEWSTLELKAPTAIERQTMRLHSANILIKQGKRDAAKAMLDTITEEPLQKQKDKLLGALAAPPESKKE